MGLAGALGDGAAPPAPLQAPQQLGPLQPQAGGALEPDGLADRVVELDLVDGPACDVGGGGREKGKR